VLWEKHDIILLLIQLAGFIRFRYDRRIVEKLISTPGDHFEFCSMPMSVCSTPDTFQQLIKNVLSGLVESKALIYLEDTVIWGATLEEQNQRLVDFLTAYGFSHLTLNLIIESFHSLWSVEHP
jgi:hypothetical protein